MRKLAAVLVFLGMLDPFASIVGAQELQEGKWTVGLTREGRTLNLTLEVKRIPDPHDRWRPGTGQLVTITAMRGQNVVTVIDVRLDGEKLSYRFVGGPGGLGACNLTRQKDGSYAGECVGADERTRVPITPITMTPPQK